MGFMKNVKNKSWYKRYQLPKRRRRQGKTDYKQRRNMCKQAKNKYNSAKYRLVVRFSNKSVLCQIAYATILGDRTICQASSRELPKYGVPSGLKNYAATYCTGLLVARRLLKQFNLDGNFKGIGEINGKEYHVEDEDNERKPFKVILDVGLMQTSVGARCFAALKGAADGGLHVPHSTKRFPGYKPPEERGAEPDYDAEAHSDRIFGKHVGEYMEMLEEEDPTKYEAHFAKFIAAGIGGGELPNVYKKAHAAIKADPSVARKPKKELKNVRKGKTIICGDNKYQRNLRLTLKQRKEKVRQKIATAQAKMLAAAQEEE